MQEYYQKEPKFNDVYSRNNSPEIKNGVHFINLDEYKSIVTHWIDFYVNGNYVTYFDSLGVEHILQETKIFIGNKKYRNKYI